MNEKLIKRIWIILIIIAGISLVLSSLVPLLFAL